VRYRENASVALEIRARGICYAGIVFALAALSYIGAYRDLKKNPGPKGPR